MILVTRPQEPGRALAAHLRAAACDALWWPAFDLLPAPDPDALRASVEALAHSDLAVFVSAEAVRSFAAALRAAKPGRSWPAGVRVAAVGAATRSCALEQLPGLMPAQLIGPAGQSLADAGSESLWTALQALAPPPRRALIVRALTGRAWLAERLRESGVHVEEAVAYRRKAHVPHPIQWSALRACREAGAALATLFTSTEAVAVLEEQFAAGALADWPRAGIALSVHARIEAALRDRGWTRVRSCAAEAASICAALPREFWGPAIGEVADRGAGDRGARDAAAPAVSVPLAS